MATIDTLTPNEAWEIYVGDQSPQEFVDFADLTDDRNLTAALVDYVTSSPACEDLSSAERDQVAELLARHIEANA